MKKYYDFPILGLIDSAWQLFVGVFLLFVQVEVAIPFLLMGAIALAASILSQRYTWANWVMLGVGVLGVCVIACMATAFLFPSVQDLFANIDKGSSVKKSTEALQAIFHATTITEDMNSFGSLFSAVFNNCFSVHSGILMLFAGVIRVLKYNIPFADPDRADNYKKMAYIYMIVFVVARFLWISCPEWISSATDTIAKLQSQLADAPASMALAEKEALASKIASRENLLAFLPYIKSVALFIFAAVPSYLTYLTARDVFAEDMKMNLIIGYGLSGLLMIVATVVLALNAASAIFAILLPLLYIACGAAYKFLLKD